MKYKEEILMEVGRLNMPTQVHISIQNCIVRVLMVKSIAAFKMFDYFLGLFVFIFPL